MHKTVYIEPDEEITSIANKIKREPSNEIYLVVPKNAVLVQGVINLEILRREAFKFNKNLIFVTSDQQTKSFLEKLDLDVQEGLSRSYTSNNTDIEEEILERTVSDSMGKTNKIEQSREIGSESFYGGEKISADEIKKTLTDKASQVAARAALSEEAISEPERRSYPMRVPVEVISPHQTDRISRQRILRKTDSSFSDYPAGQEQSFQRKLDPRFKIRQKEAEKFFSSSYQTEKPSSASIKKPFQGGKKLKWIFFIIIIILILGGAGSWIFMNLPKVTVSVYPQDKTVSQTFSVAIYSGASGNEEKNEISGQLEELEISHELKFEATGEKFSSDKGKARGKVEIANNYSSNSQPLVAGTRVLSENKKLFRLLESVTVPGMKDGQPGKIEAKVIADEPGASFNIDISKFTIEGFKGGPKYEKFEVVSKDKMEGGLDNVDNQKVKVVTQNDIEQARGKVMDSFNGALEEKIKEKIGSGKTFLFDSIEKEITESFASENAGAIADQFSFTLKQKIRAITFLEEDARNLAIKALEKETPDGNELNKTSINLRYEKGNADFEKKEMKFEMATSAQSWPKINQNEIKAGVAGKSEEEIKEFLQKYKNIKKAEIERSPAWLSFLPITEEKVIIKEIR